VTSTDGTELSTRFHGDRDRPRVLLQHGVGSSCTYLDEAVVPPMVADGWCVVVADLRGHGASSPVSDPADHSLERLVQDVEALVAAVGATAVGGVSAGGHAAVAAAARGGVEVERVVAALPAWSGTAVAGEGPHAAIAAEIRDVGVAGMLQRLRAEPDLLPWLRRVLLRDMGRGDLASIGAGLMALDGGTAPTLGEIAALPCPLGVVGWSHDPGHPLAVARHWADAAPDGRLVTLALDDPDREPLALGRATAAALGPPP